MDYRDELRESARKRSVKDQRNKIIMLVIVLIIIFIAIHFLGKKSKEVENSFFPEKAKTSQENILPSVDETK